MKITRDDATWLYTVTDDKGRARILSSVTTIIDSALHQFRGFETNQFAEMLQSEINGAREKVSQITAGVVGLMGKVINAGHFGRAVHQLTELDDRENLDEESLDPALVPILHAWRKFRVDHRPVMIYAEHLVASKLGYAGTLDRVAEINGQRVLLEIKSRPYKQGRDGLQTIAYQKAYEEMTKTKISKRYVLELSLAGTYILTINSDRQDWDMFRTALAIHNYRRKYEI